jgi:hypothetical protein
MKPKRKLEIFVQCKSQTRTLAIVYFFDFYMNTLEICEQLCAIKRGWA